MLFIIFIIFHLLIYIESIQLYKKGLRKRSSILIITNTIGIILNAIRFSNTFNLSVTVLNFLSEGLIVAVVSDRGTPGISDPGYALIKEAIKENYNVVCLPGATAFVPAMVMSGLSTDRFLFYGFLNSKKTKQKKELELLKDNRFPIIFYEAPHRIKETLENIKDVFGNRKAVLAREISKKFEEIIRDDINTLIDLSSDLKGEMVIIVDGNTRKSDFSNLTIEDHVNMFMEDGYDSKEAIKLVAKARNLPKSEVYGKYHKK